MQMEMLQAGTVLHRRYRIERAVGSGGFGHVYLAVDLSNGAQYAVKEYLVTGTSGKVQLEHEARVLSQLHHPNLPAFQAAFDERGHYYIVLGYIEGNDLTEYMRVVRQKNEVIPIAQLMSWLLSICEAVTFMHSQHPPFIHRDIKPDNIRIMPSGTAVLVDMGNAKAAADGARTLFFIRHQGTPGYAPLEQYPGGTGTDARSDVYALGGTLYFALTAHEPPNVSTRNQAIQQRLPDLPTLQELLAQNPPEGSGQELKQFRLGVSKPGKPAPRHSRHLAQLGTLSPELLARLNAIIQRAMAMKQKDRYPSVAEFSHELRTVLLALPSSTQPPGSGNSRPIDPHGTQPDLPLLFEAMQDQRAQAAQDASTKPAPPPTMPPPATPPGPSTRQTQSNSAGNLRCPRCDTELTRPSVACPRCGTPLTGLFSSGQAQPPFQPPAQSPGRPASYQMTPQTDIADEATMLVSPPSPPAQATPSPQVTQQSPDADATLVRYPRPGQSPSPARQAPQTPPSTPRPSGSQSAQVAPSTPLQASPALPQGPRSTGLRPSTGPQSPQSPQSAQLSQQGAPAYAPGAPRPFMQSTTGPARTVSAPVRSTGPAIPTAPPPPMQHAPPVLPSPPTSTAPPRGQLKLILTTAAILFVVVLFVLLVLLTRH